MVRCSTHEGPAEDVQPWLPNGLVGDGCVELTSNEVDEYESPLLGVSVAQAFRPILCRLTIRMHASYHSSLATQ